MAQKEEKREYRLSIRFPPWQATLQPLGAEKEAPCEEFSSPLELLERLERPPTRQGGVK